METDKKIKKFIRKVRKRLCVQTFWKVVLIAVIVGFCIWGIINSIGLIIPFYASVLWGLLGFVVSLAAGMLISPYFFPNMQKTAAKIDSLGFKERFTTSLALEGDNSAISNLQKLDTLKRTNKLSISKMFPAKVSKKLLIILFASLVFTLGTAMIPAKTREEAVAEHELKKDIKESKKELKEKAEELIEEYNLTEEQQAQLKEILEGAGSELNEAKETSDIAKAEEKFKSKVEKQITGTTDSEKEARAIQNALEKASQGKLTKADQEEIAEKLGELAEEAKDEEMQKIADQIKDSVAQGKGIPQNMIDSAKGMVGDYADGSKQIGDQAQQQAGNPGQQSGGNQGQQPGGEQGQQPGGSQGQQPGGSQGQQPGGSQGQQPGGEQGQQPGGEQGQQPGGNQGQQPGGEQGQQPGGEQGQQPGGNQGQQPGGNQGQQPGGEQGQQPGGEQGQQPGGEQGQQPGGEQGQQPGGEQGQQPGGEQGQQPGGEQGQQPGSGQNQVPGEQGGTQGNNPGQQPNSPGSQGGMQGNNPGTSNGGGQQTGGSSSGGGWFNGSKYGKQKSIDLNGEQVLVTEGNFGTNESLNGKAIEGGESKMVSSDNALTFAGEKKNYQSVIGDYSNKAYSDINNSKVPESMKNMIKNYFTDLN